MNKEQVYLDACKTTRLDPKVLEEMKPYFLEKYWFPGNFTDIGNEIADEISESQKKIAKTINAEPGEIIFTSGGTDGNNIALKGIMAANREKGKHFITSKVSHPSVLTVFKALEDEGYEGTYISADEEGYLDLEELRSSIRKDTTLVALTHINHTLGTVQKIDAISEILQNANHKINFFLDSCEAYTKIPIDVKKQKIDAISISGHKFNGPKGTGFLFVKDGTKVKKTQNGIARLHPLKPGVVNVPGIVGITKAADLIFEDFEGHVERLANLQKKLYDGIKQRIDDIRLNGPALGERSPAHLNISFMAVEGEAIMMMLNFDDIHIETGSACSAKELKADYIMMNTGRTFEESHGSVRFTLDKFVTEEQIDKTIDSLEKTIKELRRRSPLGKKKTN
ncbi:MAG: cysteine desulfurase [Candidatus Cloacimonetes bacterium]|nr:cysteine desulfurase [Candidatus Cloacimonadota bacterium]MBS3767124.1 cysteine desulfurase [Candidatus Cloacimonadota bacterium]